jgi:hypothetical protein
MDWNIAKNSSGRRPYGTRSFVSIFPMFSLQSLDNNRIEWRPRQPLLQMPLLQRCEVLYVSGLVET